MSARMIGLVLPTAQALTILLSSSELRKLPPDSCITTSQAELSSSYVSVHRPLPRSHSLIVLSQARLTAERQRPSMSTDPTHSECPSIMRTHLLAVYGPSIPVTCTVPPSTLKGNSHQRRTPGFASVGVCEQTSVSGGTPGFATNPWYHGNPGV